MNDWRTDNWAGRRDPNTDPKNYHYPRSAREAGFHYIPESQQEKDLGNWAVIGILLVIVLAFVLLENLHWLA